MIAHIRLNHWQELVFRFKLLSLLYEMKGLQLPAKAYELLLLGTIADVVPLLGENRFWVRYGLNYVNNIESLSLKCLSKMAKLQSQFFLRLILDFLLHRKLMLLGDWKMRVKELNFYWF